MYNDKPGYKQQIQMKSYASICNALKHKYVAYKVIMFSKASCYFLILATLKPFTHTLFRAVCLDISLLGSEWNINLHVERKQF